MTTTQRYELEAWLGDDHDLTDEQVETLVQISDEIYARYCTPDPDVDDPEMVERDLAQASEVERDAALTVAYRLITEDHSVIDEYAADLARARSEADRATAGLRQAALMVVAAANVVGTESEAGFARRAGVDRMTVRKWLGKQTAKENRRG